MKCPARHPMSGAHAISVTLHGGVDLDHLAEGPLSGVSGAKSLSSPGQWGALRKEVSGRSQTSAHISGRTEEHKRRAFSFCGSS